MLESWRGVRPVIHASFCREDLLQDHAPTLRPDYQALLQEGYKPAKLRAHSDYCWNSACNEWVLEHWNWADIMTEAKMKNLASAQLYSMTEESKQMAA